MTAGKAGASEAVARLRGAADAGTSRTVDWRLDQLERLRDAVLDHEDLLVGALVQDLGKPAPEGFATEVGLVVREIDYVRRHLERWARPTRVRLPLWQLPGRALVRREPLGVVLVVAPWNYPVYLSLMPTVSALAAGNRVLVKPSELAPATTAALGRVLGDGSGGRATALLEGGAEVVHEALAAGVDHLFFTGSSEVGRLVAEAAARRLVPVTLELGGKCPAIVDSGVDARVVARRIAWSKFSNAGQTCVAPDYVLVHRDISERLLAELAGAVTSMYGDEPHRSRDYARIIDGARLSRLSGLLEDHGGEVVLGGECDPDDRFLAPTIVRDPIESSPLMSEEIFGPILPVVSVDSMRAALAVVRARPDPLAVYAFSGDPAVLGELEAGTRSGSFCVNTAVTQLAVDGLPFGGVGHSGTGVSHGRFGVDAMSQLRAVVHRSVRPDVALHHPPYRPVKSWLVRRALCLPPRRRYPAAGTDGPRGR